MLWVYELQNKIRRTLQFFFLNRMVKHTRSCYSNTH